jgi:DcmR-like sensory protein
LHATARLLDNLATSPGAPIFFLFYETKLDLLDALVPYFRAGLENNEFSAWAVAEPLTGGRSPGCIEPGIPQFHRHLTDGDIEILPGRKFHLNGEQVVLERVSQQWTNKLNWALLSGYHRTSTHPCCAESTLGQMAETEESGVSPWREFSGSFVGGRVWVVVSAPRQI